MAIVFGSKGCGSTERESSIVMALIPFSIFNLGIFGGSMILDLSDAISMNCTNH